MVWRLLGRGQVVRRLTLDQEIGGSNPPAPASALATSTPTPIGGRGRELQTGTGLMGQVLLCRTAPRVAGSCGPRRRSEWRLLRSTPPQAIRPGPVALGLSRRLPHKGPLGLSRITLSVPRSVPRPPRVPPVVCERGEYQSRAAHSTLERQGQLAAPGSRRPPVRAEPGVGASLTSDTNKSRRSGLRPSRTYP